MWLSVPNSAWHANYTYKKLESIALHPISLWHLQLLSTTEGKGWAEAVYIKPMKQVLGTLICIDPSKAFLDSSNMFMCSYVFFRVWKSKTIWLQPVKSILSKTTPFAPTFESSRCYSESLKDLNPSYCCNPLIVSHVVMTPVIKLLHCYFICIILILLWIIM